MISRVRDVQCALAVYREIWQIRMRREREQQGPKPEILKYSSCLGYATNFSPQSLSKFGLLVQCCYVGDLGGMKKKGRVEGEK